MIRQLTDFNIPYRNTSIWIISILCFMSILCISCAKKVTDKEAIGNTLSITVNFNSNSLNFTTYDYYLIFSSDAQPIVYGKIFGVDATTEYFISPGRLFDENLLDAREKTINDYYVNYFSGWSNALVFFNSILTTPQLLQGPFPNTIATTDAHEGFQPAAFIPQLTSSGGALSLQFQLSFLQGIIGDTNTERLHISIVVAEKATASLDITGNDYNTFTTNLIDFNESNISIQLIKGAQTTGTDTDITAPPASADIKNWRIEIF